MGKIVSGTFDGFGAAINLGLGFIPDWFNLYNQEASGSSLIVRWTRNHRSASGYAGVRYSIDDGANAYSSRTLLTTGIAVYYGDDVADGTQTYLRKDPDPDKRNNGAGSTITKWTLDSTASKYGHFDYPVDTAVVGVGSIIKVRQDKDNKIRTATITAISNDGDAVNDLTTNVALPSGTVLDVTGMYDYIAVPSGSRTKEGVTISETTCNVDNDMLEFEAGLYDN